MSRRLGAAQPLNRDFNQTRSVNLARQKRHHQLRNTMPALKTLELALDVCCDG
jgi:hypothetical protein